MKSTKRIPLMVLVAIISLSVGVFAGSSTQKITATLNKVLSVKVDGEVFKPVDSKGQRIYPIIYGGRTYLPANAFADALGATAAYDSKGNGTLNVTSIEEDEDGVPTEDINNNSSGSNSGNNSSGSNDSNVGSGKTTSVTYDKSKQSTWVKFSNIKIIKKTDSEIGTYYVVGMDATNIHDETIEVSTYGDVGLLDKDDDMLQSVIGIEEDSSCELKPGKTARVYKGFKCDSLDDLSYIDYYPLSAPDGDRTIIYKN